MRPIDRLAREAATEQRHLVSRNDLIEAGGTQDAIWRRVRSGQWLALQAGVYQVDSRNRLWEDDLLAAILAAGPGAYASHRAALVLWGLDGISSAPVEITVPYTHGPVPDGTIVHRTRRPIGGTVLARVPVTSIERTLLDCASMMGTLILTKAVESALRKRLVTEEHLYRFLKEMGGRGVKGTRLLRHVLNARTSEKTTGSGSETEALYHIRRSDLPEPKLQQRFIALDGTPIVPDFYWPVPNKAVEIDGIDAHDSADKLDHDLRRQNKLMDLGIDLRRFSARMIRREPEQFISDLHQFLAT